MMDDCGPRIVEIPKDTDTLEDKLGIFSEAKSRHSTIDWSFDRVVDLEDEDRVPIVTILLEKAKKYNVTPPEWWADVLFDPEKYNLLHSDALGKSSGPFDDSPEYVSPTATSEAQLPHLSG